jgi:hypothetical protein
MKRHGDFEVRKACKRPRIDQLQRIAFGQLKS